MKNKIMFRKLVKLFFFFFFTFAGGLVVAWDFGEPPFSGASIICLLFSALTGWDVYDEMTNKDTIEIYIGDDWGDEE